MTKAVRRRRKGSQWNRGRFILVAGVDVGVDRPVSFDFGDLHEPSFARARRAGAGSVARAVDPAPHGHSTRSAERPLYPAYAEPRRVQPLGLGDLLVSGHRGLLTGPNQVQLFVRSPKCKCIREHPSVPTFAQAPRRASAPPRKSLVRTFRWRWVKRLGCVAGLVGWSNLVQPALLL